jgi:metal-sulfur cluster biosynthetic enzyme
MPLTWSQLGTFQGEEDTTEAPFLRAPSSSSSSSKIPTPTTAQDKAVFKALVDCSVATNGNGVHLLRQAGLNLPDFVTKKNHPEQQRPMFHIVRTHHDKTDEARASKEPPLPPPTQRHRLDDDDDDKLTAAEVFDIIRNIQDPEHPHTLEALGVVSLEQVELKQEGDDHSTTSVHVRFTPTIPHCSMATLIGLCLRVKLHRSLPLPGRFKVNVQIEPGTHASEKAINKQLRDKERVCAALENKHLAGVVNKCIRQGMETP